MLGYCYLLFFFLSSWLLVYAGALMRTVLVALLFFCTAFGSMVAESPARWVEVRSPHFVVLTDSNEKQARRVAVQLESQCHGR
jgi:hypothetical protein